ncbi:MAG: hypothetical protein ACW96U_00825 [Candidatus Heimdallarchaeaceae archaeon]|jgi:hypothetical protein
MYEVIRWWKDGYKALGRNGSVKCRGVIVTNIYPSNKEKSGILIEPINSKGDISGCRIEFPKEIIPDVVKFLNNVYYNEEFFEEER